MLNANIEANIVAKRNKEFTLKYWPRIIKLSIAPKFLTAKILPKDVESKLLGIKKEINEVISILLDGKKKLITPTIAEKRITYVSVLRSLSNSLQS